MVVARNTCLLLLKVTKITYNNIFLGPILRMIRINAQLNISSMLQFGNET